MPWLQVGAADDACCCMPAVPLAASSCCCCDDPPAMCWWDVAAAPAAASAAVGEGVADTTCTSAFAATLGVAWLLATANTAVSTGPACTDAPTDAQPTAAAGGAAALCSKGMRDLRLSSAGIGRPLLLVLTGTWLTQTAGAAGVAWDAAAPPDASAAKPKALPGAGVAAAAAAQAGAAGV